MKLARTVRNTARFGSLVYAVVEGVSLGLATVRLVGRGNRLTNLPVVGSPVVVGQNAVVEMATEGHPFVRPITVAEDEIVLPRADPSSLDTDKGAFPKGPVYAKLTRETSDFQFLAWFEEIFGEHPESYVLEMDTIVKDSGGLVATNPDYNKLGFFIKHPGMYHTIFRAAFEGPPAWTTPNRGEYMKVNIWGFLTPGSIYQDSHGSRYNWMDPSGLYIHETQYLTYWPAGWWVMGIIGAKMEFQTGEEPDIWITSPISSPAGIYPSLEISLIAPLVPYE